MRLIGYARISDPGKQGDNYSLPGQEARLRGWCQLYGHELVDVLVEGESGKSVSGRPVFKRALQRILRLHEADGLLVVCLDRFSRDEADAHLIKRAFDKAGKFIICTDEPINTAEPHGDVIFGLLVSLAAAEYKKIVGRFKTGITRAKAEGRDLRSTAPYGYQFIGSGKERELIENEEEQAVIKQIQNYPGSNGAIAAYLNRHGVKPRNGERWQSCTIRVIKQRLAVKA